MNTLAMTAMLSLAPPALMSKIAPDYVGSQLAAVLALLNDGRSMRIGLALVLLHG